jgi:hypothetical protein
VRRLSIRLDAAEAAQMDLLLFVVGQFAPREGYAGLVRRLVRDTFQRMANAPDFERMLEQYRAAGGRLPPELVTRARR